MRTDNRITLGLVLAVSIEAASFFIWAGQASARLSAAEKRIEEASDISERLTRLEEQVAQTRASLARIERKLEGE